jgi:hypothetical protein
MGVERFRCAVDMNAEPSKVSADAGFDRFVRHCARFRRIAPLDFPRGVFKFRSLEEAQRARAEISRKNAHRLRRGAHPG